MKHLGFCILLWSSLVHGGVEINGGSLVTSSSPLAAHSVLVVFFSDQNEVTGSCSGVLIGPRQVVTAGHCTPDSARNAHMGILFSTSLRVGGPIRDVVRAWRHPLFDAQSLHQNIAKPDAHDIGVLQFAGSLPPNYLPAKVLSDNYPLKVGERAILAGYGAESGQSPALSAVEVPVSKPRFGQTEILFDQKNGIGACYGDSGGPAFLSSRDGPLLIGITSRGIGPGCTGVSVFTRVAPYWSWIRGLAAAAYN